MKKIIYINSIYDLQNVIDSLRFNNMEGYTIYPDFRLTYLEQGKYLLEVKQ